MHVEAFGGCQPVYLTGLFGKSILRYPFLCWSLFRKAYSVMQVFAIHLIGGRIFGLCLQLGVWESLCFFVDDVYKTMRIGKTGEPLFAFEKPRLNFE